jgi:hypothetical protein
LGKTLVDMDPDTITDTQIHEVETLWYSWGRLYWTWTLSRTITDTQIHEVETLRYSWGRLNWTWTLTPSQTPDP